jgi:hypothetical protein
MWFGSGTRFLLTRGEYGEISTGTAPVLLTCAGCAGRVGSTDVPFGVSSLSGQTRRLVCRGISADPCERRLFVTRELSILRSALARGPPNHPCDPFLQKGFAQSAATIRR